MRRIFDFIEALFVVFVVVGGLGGAMICGAAYLTYAITGSYQ
tara:strand:+ start:702 stop:827 length:126 start_codon:yes stop_codon:yes gene_type:complete